jgi:hypothetical protein
MATQHTAASLAFDIIGRNKDKIQGVKYAPRGDKAEAVRRFMGRAVTAEIFISEKQAEFLGNLIGDAGVITHGTGDQKFGAFVKDIYSESKGRTYYLLTFCGFVPQPEEAAPMTRDEVADMHADAETAQQKADDFAASLIRRAMEQNRVQFEKHDDEFAMTWLSKAQADALTANLKGAVKPDGSFITQACGCFCYWGKKRTMNGAMLLCWMGEPEDAPVVEAAPKGIIPAGKRIPLDPAIPF